MTYKIDTCRMREYLWVFLCVAFWLCVIWGGGGGNTIPFSLSTGQAKHWPLADPNTSSHSNNGHLRKAWCQNEIPQVFLEFCIAHYYLLMQEWRIYIELDCFIY